MITTEEVLRRVNNGEELGEDGIECLREVYKGWEESQRPKPGAGWKIVRDIAFALEHLRLSRKSRVGKRKNQCVDVAISVLEELIAGVHFDPSDKCEPGGKGDGLHATIGKRLGTDLQKTEKRRG